MNQAYLELSYRRAEDDAPVTLVAELPTVRPIDVGGAPTDLRLSGVDPKALYATISHTYDHFRIEARDADCPVVVNGQRIREEGVELHDADTIRVKDFELTFHDGEPSDEPPLIDTQLRWKLRRPEVEEEDSLALGDENSRPYIEEFHLTIRPLLQAERHAEVQRRAESEIKRILRLDEAEALERYVQVLWWTRVRMAREAGDELAIDLAREALDLYPDFSPLMVACGTTLLSARDWPAARSAFTQALRDCRPEFVVSRHDARIGRILAESCAATPDSDSNAGAKPPQQWGADDWNVPSIRVQSPGDELLLWRMARYARLFGPPEQVRYVYRGLDESAGKDTELVQRWEIVDGSKGVGFRRILRVPAISLADPSLMLEAHSICELFSKADREWGKHVVDLSHQSDDSGDSIPIAFDRSALDALPPVPDNQPPTCVRIWCCRVSQTGEEIHMDMVAQPTKGDLVYRQGPFCVAIANEDAAKLAGSQLYYLQKPAGFHLKLSGGQWVAAKCHLGGKMITSGTLASLRPKTPLTTWLPLALSITAVVLAIVALVLRFALTPR